MRIYLLAIFLSLFLSNICSQEQITIGTQHKINSSILNEEREYWIHLPESYNDSVFVGAHYPVIYLLDGETNFHSLVGIQKNLTRSMYNYMPECIIVGVINVDRARDFTPSNSSAERNGKKIYANSGGAEPFHSFLISELRLEVDNLYRTSAYNILIGHSFGGLFSINTLLHHPDSFNAYVSLDPSLWWDGKKVYNDAEKLWVLKDFSKKYLFVAMAQMDNGSSDKQEHSSTIHDFCTKLLAKTTENRLLSDWKYYEEEGHGTITTIGMLDAMRKLFEGIELPVKQIPKQPNLIKEYFDKLSERLGHTFIPSEGYVDRLGQYALSVDEKNNAKLIFEYNLANYPNSEKAKRSLVSVLN